MTGKHENKWKLWGSAAVLAVLLISALHYRSLVGLDVPTRSAAISTAIVCMGGLSAVFFLMCGYWHEL